MSSGTKSLPRQATSHCLSQRWPSSMLSYGVTWPEWVNLFRQFTPLDWMNDEVGINGNTWISICKKCCFMGLKFCSWARELCCHWNQSLSDCWIITRGLLRYPKWPNAYYLIIKKLAMFWNGKLSLTTRLLLEVLLNLATVMLCYLPCVFRCLESLAVEVLACQALTAFSIFWAQNN